MSFTFSLVRNGFQCRDLSQCDQATSNTNNSRKRQLKIPKPNERLRADVFDDIMLAEIATNNTTAI
mgnify:FL=1